jgi:hypothetical protein
LSEAQRAPAAAVAAGDNFTPAPFCHGFSGFGFGGCGFGGTLKHPVWPPTQTWPGGQPFDRGPADADVASIAVATTSKAMKV